MSLETIRNQVITEIGGRTDLDSVIDDQINYSVQEIGTMYPFKELEQTAATTTVSGQYEYLLPTDLFILWSVKEETSLNRMLVYKDIRSFDEIDETKTGAPYNWSHWKNSLILYNSVPDNNGGSNYSVRIRYWKIPDTLSADADNHDLPERVERGIRLKAAAYVLRILHMEDKAQIREQEYDRWLGRMDLPEAGSERDANKSVANMQRQGTYRSRSGRR